MPERNYCLCFTLRSGTLTIGITSLVLGSMVVVSAAGIIFRISQKLQENPDFPGQYDEIRMLMGWQMAAGVLQIIFSSLLIHGVRKNKSALVLAWLIYHGIVSGLQSVAISILLVFGLTTMMHWRTGFPIIVACGLINALFWWWFAVTLKNYKKMREESGEIYRRQQDDTIMLTS